MATGTAIRRPGRAAGASGYVAGIVAFLRVDPSAASVAFTIIGGSDYRTTVFAQGQGFLGYHVFESERVVVLIDLTWI